MATASVSSSAASSSGAVSTEEIRAPAGRLPSKRGEIGYREDPNQDETEPSANTSSPLPERHPADRDSSNSNPPSLNTTASTSTSPTSTSDSSSLKKSKVLLSFLKRKKLGGLQLGTLIAFAIQLVIILGTIGGWIVAGIFLSRNSRNGSNNDSSMSAASATIFVHVLFVVAFLSQCLFLERRIYVLRAQRYAFVHPGEILPISRNNRSGENFIALSPWNRPPLPTYAAALAQSGVGTGDVEDNLIAAPPPPAYGHTRGSTLLLSGFLDANLRAQRPVSVRTEMSQQHQDRPASYASNDEEWEVIQNADYARRLEETLMTHESSGSRNSRQ
ncbi:hypothetical protein EV361DRAFT_413165 [Lentinula raphanica]|uniref:Uncharacterized protein n=1 Tax=Lentinula raphanica TaxID=153919 RepID=A0AA38P421_9AGAR|nr:hypothetical protein F5878DRAFT_288674 [Lentinula raphanica]KAJ3968505.1 hypothetical protein EV361DRAFT_413165 [Lentinula raphanica]